MTPSGTTLHITSGDIAGANLRATDIPGELLVWHDILYEGPRTPGWPDERAMIARAHFIQDMTAGGLPYGDVLDTVTRQYQFLAVAKKYNRIILWFDACLFDISMLVHIVSCLDYLHIRTAELLCIDAFPGIDPYIGIGQLTTEQLNGCAGRELPLTDEQIRYAVRADDVFARRDAGELDTLATEADTPLPWIPAAAARLREEIPDPDTGMGRLEQMALNAVKSGYTTPEAIYNHVAAAETPPQYWGDVSLWQKLNGLAGRTPPLVKISGPADRLPQWEGQAVIGSFRITAAR